MAGKKCTAKQKYEDEHRTFLVEQFKNLIAELDQGLPGDLPLHCTVRWLSKGKVLPRFFELLDAVKLFMEQKDKDYPELSDPKWIMDLAFLVDMLCRLDRLNLDLQGKLKMLPDLQAHKPPVPPGKSRQPIMQHWLKPCRKTLRPGSMIYM
ncbi:hypothetical protein KUCAC02_030742 [Chaenocephalus aceratus]|uniref:Uncharacterized protein n=1 Tax=Chaenocephalus aceratus TaxID=36190 RepID=A0ACB9XLQ4_CHAAC|nr:hypothetical protein KUCAC02_030742 [Chaenocephalus aceratus]